MTTPRLTFLYPQLLRTVRISDVATRTTRRCLSDTARRGAAAGTPFDTSAARMQIARRHGKAVEPLPAIDESAVPKQPPTPEVTLEAAQTQEQPDHQQQQQAQSPPADSATKEAADEVGSEPGDAVPSEPVASEAVDGEGKDDARAEAKKGGPLESILHMGPPPGHEPSIPDSEGRGNGDRGKMGHMSTPPYVHHFDAYSLVKQLEAAGYTPEQAVSSMKAIRKILAQNLDVAQESLVSKSDVENETYLFRAACSELGTEVKNNQRIADEEMRQKRTLLQHEVDILSQSLSQEVLTLNDNVRGMFNDRKIAVREEQKGVDSTIQQINYKISISLSSDAKSEIEGLRWVLIRRSVIGIIFMAVFTLGTLRYGTYVSHKKKSETERIEKQAEMLRAADGKRDHSSAPDAAEILAAS